MERSSRDHSFSQLFVHKALTCTKGQGGWAVAPSPLSETFKSCTIFGPSITAFGIRWACICDGTRDVVHSLEKKRGWNIVRCVAGLLVAVGNDNGHSFRLLPVHKALTCPQGRAVAPLCLTKETQCNKKNLTRSSAPISCRLK